MNQVLLSSYFMVKHMSLCIKLEATMLGYWALVVLLICDCKGVWLFACLAKIVKV